MSATLEPNKKLTLSPDAPLRQAIIDAMSSILAYAVQMAKQAKDEPVVAVHEYRKSLRRARALLRLLQAELGPDFSELNGQLRELVRRTSQTRDLDVLADTLGGLPEPLKAKEQRDREAVLALITQTRQEREALDISALLARDLDILQTMRFDLVQAMPEDYGWEQLCEGIARAHKRARMALANAIAHGDDEDIHDWRKRVKELRYQLELLTSRHHHAPLEDAHEHLSALAERLGQVTDLMILRDFIVAHRQAFEKSPKRLLKHLEALIEEGFDGCVHQSKHLFGYKPRAFARHILDPVLPLHALPPSSTTLTEQDLAAARADDDEEE